MLIGLCEAAPFFASPLGAFSFFLRFLLFFFPLLFYSLFLFPSLLDG